LVQTLYLPPTTGTMRMPATRMPLGLSASADAFSAGPDSAEADGITEGIEAAAASAAEHLRNDLRLAFIRVLKTISWEGVQQIKEACLFKTRSIEEYSHI
jgi:hypothetical protein